MGGWRVECIRHAIVWLVPRVLGTPPRFIYRANSLDKVHARLDGRKKDIFRRGSYY